MRVNPNEELQPFVTVDGPESANAGMQPKSPATSSEDRLAAARLQALWRAKKFNLMDRPSAYFQDFAGPNTSAWDAARCEWLCQTLKIVPGYQLQTEDRRNGPLERYSSREGAWILKDQRITIQEVRELIDQHIKKLKLSKTKLFQFMAEERPWEKTQDFLAASFEEKLKWFREGN